jgi:hypothetical protein
MSGEERLPDDALVVRCGQPPFDPVKVISEGCREHPSGHFGFSVQSAPGASIEALAAWCRNSKIGWTTVDAIRSAGYEVVMTSGPIITRRLLFREIGRWTPLGFSSPSSGNC